MKICDFGLARSISGVESASVILEGRKFAKDSQDEETKADEYSKDVMLQGAELSKINHKDDLGKGAEAT